MSTLLFHWQRFSLIRAFIRSSVAGVIEPVGERQGGVMSPLFSSHIIGSSGSWLETPHSTDGELPEMFERGNKNLWTLTKIAWLGLKRPTIQDSMLLRPGFRESESSGFLSLCERWPPSYVSSVYIHRRSFYLRNWEDTSEGGYLLQSKRKPLDPDSPNAGPRRIESQIIGLLRHNHVTLAGIHTILSPPSNVSRSSPSVR